MRLPRDVSGDDLIAGLHKLGFTPTRQTGSHVRLTHIGDAGTFHLTVPRHKDLRIGTLNGIVREVALQLDMERDKLIRMLFDS